MTLSSLFWRTAHKWPRMQRLELLEVPELGIRYINIPKTGTGTTRMAIHRQLSDRAGERLPKSVLWRYTRWVRKSDMLSLEPCFTFAFARNPYERLASLYRHKIARARSEGRRLSPLFFVYGRRFSLNMSFEEFVRAVCATPDHRAEKHFRSQSSFLFVDGKPLADFLGSVEDFDTAWKAVCERSGLEPLAREYNRTDPDQAFALSDWYDDQLLGMVNDRYAEDFQRLGYEAVSTVR